MKHLLIAVTLVVLAGVVGPAAVAIDCPDEYLECGNVPGKSCKLEPAGQCTIVDLGERYCERPGPDFWCQNGQTVGKKNCDCVTKLQMECCPDCEEQEGFMCGSCEAQDGQQSLICLHVPCAGPCTAQYCTGEGVGCVWSGICEQGGCCAYTCNVSIPSCTGVDPCPAGACSC